MNRNELINRLVARKMTASGKVKIFCEVRKFCFAGTQQPARADRKN